MRPNDIVCKTMDLNGVGVKDRLNAESWTIGSVTINVFMLYTSHGKYKNELSDMN